MPSAADPAAVEVDGAEHASADRKFRTRSAAVVPDCGGVVVWALHRCTADKIFPSKRARDVAFCLTRALRTQIAESSRVQTIRPTWVKCQRTRAAEGRSMDRSLVRTDQRPLGIGTRSGARRQGTEWSRRLRRTIIRTCYLCPAQAGIAAMACAGRARGGCVGRKHADRAPLRCGDCARRTSESPAEPPTLPRTPRRGRLRHARAAATRPSGTARPGTPKREGATREH